MLLQLLRSISFKVEGFRVSACRIGFLCGARDLGLESVITLSKLALFDGVLYLILSYSLFPYSGLGKFSFPSTMEVQA